MLNSCAIRLACKGYFRHILVAGVRRPALEFVDDCILCVRVIINKRSLERFCVWISKNLLFWLPFCSSTCPLTPHPPTPASVNRYGTGDLCWHHAQQVLSLVLRINSLLPPFCSSASPLTSLFCRLVKFLTPQHQVSSWQVCTCCQW